MVHVFASQYKNLQFIILDMLKRPLFIKNGNYYVIIIVFDKADVANSLLLLVLSHWECCTLKLRGNDSRAMVVRPRTTTAELKKKNSASFLAPSDSAPKATSRIHQGTRVALFSARVVCATLTNFGVTKRPARASSNLPNSSNDRCSTVFARTYVALDTLKGPRRVG